MIKHNIFYRLLLILTLLMGCTHSGNCKKISTKLKQSTSHTASKSSTTFNLSDCDSTITQNLIFTGFDKNTNSSHESFFIVNKTALNISAIKAKITYMTMDGRQLNSRIETLPIAIPAGETRSVNIKSWDKQHSFHYFRSLKITKLSTPFDVVITPLSIEIPNSFHQ